MNNTKWEVKNSISSAFVYPTEGNRIYLGISNGQEGASVQLGHEELKSLIDYLIHVDNYYESVKIVTPKVPYHSRSELEREITEMRSHSELAGAISYRH